MWWQWPTRTLVECLQKIDLLFLECCTVFSECCFTIDVSKQTCLHPQTNKPLAEQGWGWQQVFRNGFAACVIKKVIYLSVQVPSINSQLEIKQHPDFLSALTYHLPGKLESTPTLQADTFCAYFPPPGIITIYYNKVLHKLRWKAYS